MVVVLNKRGWPANSLSPPAPKPGDGYTSMSSHPQTASVPSEVIERLMGGNGAGVYGIANLLAAAPA